MKSTVFSLLATFIILVAANYPLPHLDLVKPGPAELLTYPGKVPLPPCGTVYLLTCNQNAQKIPCLAPPPPPAPAPYHPAPPPPPAPLYHKSAPAPYHPPPPPPPGKY